MTDPNGETPDQVEQITKIPKEATKPQEKIKDPKKVAAGRALAKKNREARAAKAAADARKQEEELKAGTLLTTDNIVKAGALVGAAFTLWHGWTVVEPIGAKLWQRSETKAKQSKSVRFEEPEQDPTPPPPPPSSEPVKPYIGIDMDRTFFSLPRRNEFHGQQTCCKRQRGHGVGWPQRSDWLRLEKGLAKDLHK